MLKLAIVGKGLIGGSLEKAALRAGHQVVIFDKGEDFLVDGADIVFVAVPPSAVVPVVDAIAPRLKAGAVVVDVTGVKAPIYRELQKYAFEKRWSFVGGHPMAGKEKCGYANSCAELFDGASMILTPYPTYGRAPLDCLEKLLKELGFARIVYTDPRHHDEMIAFTSQLCHLLSSAYVREELARDHVGYSAGSFRDLARVGAPDPDTWTELFFANKEALLPVLARYLNRLEDFQAALKTDDRARMHAALAAGVAAKAQFGKGLT